MGCLHQGGGSASGGIGQTPLHQILWDMINKWAVCILLECILVHYIFPGAFQPPADSAYALMFYGLIAGTNSGNIYIKQNDHVLCRGYLCPEQYDTAICTAIVDLATGNSVRVTRSSGNPSILRGDLYSGFNSFLIYDS